MASSDAGVPMEHATLERPRHLGGEEAAQAAPADPPHQLADQPAERDPVVAVAGSGFPGRLARRHAGGDGLGVVPARTVPAQQRIGPGQPDGARLVAEELAHRGRRLARLPELGPVAHHGRVEVELAPVLEHVGAQRRHALGRRHDHAPGRFLPRPPVAGPAGPEVDDALAVHEGAERAAPCRRSPPPARRRRSPSPTTTVAPSPMTSATRSKPGAVKPSTVTAPAAPSRPRATTRPATTTR